LTANDQRGPNWIHGTEKNPLIPLAEEAKSVTQTSLFSEGRVRTGNGRDLSDNEAEEYSEEMWTLFQEGIAYSEEHADSIGINESFFDLYRDRVFKKYKGEEERVIMQQMGSILGGIVAGDIRKQSLKNLSLERPIPGGEKTHYKGRRNLLFWLTEHKMIYISRRRMAPSQK